MHPISNGNKYFTKSLLIEANNAAIREKRNRQLEPLFLDSLDKNKVCPIVQTFAHHNKGETRVFILLDEKNIGSLDLS